MPLLDLDAVQPDLDIVKLVSDKLLQKHRVLPLVRRGKRLSVAVSDPTNLHALDEIKFQTGLSVEAVVVEEDKLQKIASKAIIASRAPQRRLQCERRSSPRRRSARWYAQPVNTRAG